MATNYLKARITINPKVCSGMPCIRGIRIPVTTILKLLACDMSFEKIIADYPDLTREDILACLEYTAWVASERVIPIEVGI